MIVFISGKENQNLVRDILTWVTQHAYYDKDVYAIFIYIDINYMGAEKLMFIRC